MENRKIGSLVGLAIGDAVGTTVEFEIRGNFEPVTDMMGGGPFRLNAGEWTDDTSMALCLAHSLVFRNGFDAVDQMNRYCNWYQYGYMSSTGECFDIGFTVSTALRSYLESGNPFSGAADEYSSGNGSLMRLAPIPMFFSDLEECIQFAGESSRTTHGSAECIDSCKLFASLLYHAYASTEKAEIFTRNTYKPATDKVSGISEARFLDNSYSQLTGSGYVIESLESALWCFMNSNSFEECVLMAANIGNDADTTAAIAGQIAGAFYGLENIPSHWVDKLAMKDEILEIASKLSNAGKIDIMLRES
ncbi:ADP-ribosylglycohydrolase family protein [Thalassolituus alkanivorans]|uniref:ADP-ribosylglycohydrolase family protein n=1 Tax=Thalassolituus alkanivorans TaxID=2881055 RepID=UPI001E40B111|nr:ADP-ribosylglycohydrolase family protein [Thalassolituus alkanivorans]MCB2385466.1 ADP-ribosylglycohydrolase family protein [Thalassolituus alkanivorans]MCB2423278.1 ADP-ribosylglycohydrolase family protein [Thalassolituus alkanivorans]